MKEKSAIQIKYVPSFCTYEYVFRLALSSSGTAKWVEAIQ